MSVPISPCKILVLGHSYVYWVGAFVRSAGPTSAGLFGDFEVAGRPCELAYEGIRGATVDTLLSPTVMSRVVARRADIMVLHIGGNDICGRAASPPIMVALDVFRLARRLLEAGTRRVVVCQVCRRSRWRGLSYEDGVISRPFALTRTVFSSGRISAFGIAFTRFSAPMVSILTMSGIIVFIVACGGR